MDGLRGKADEAHHLQAEALDGIIALQIMPEEGLRDRPLAPDHE